MLSGPLTLSLSHEGRGNTTLLRRLRTEILWSCSPVNFIDSLRSNAFEKSPGRFMVELWIG